MLRDVRPGQIETAAGHLGEATNKRNYRHLRPDYLKEFVAAVEDNWRELRHYTTVHLRYQNNTEVISLAPVKASISETA